MTRRNRARAARRAAERGRAGQRDRDLVETVQAAAGITSAQVNEARSQHPSGPNPYTCRTCGGITMTRHVDQGVTPAFLACRVGAEHAITGVPVCGGEAASGWYPLERDPVPPELRSLPVWEWYAPADRSGFFPAMVDHLDRGGLALRGPVAPDWDRWDAERLAG